MDKAITFLLDEETVAKIDAWCKKNKCKRSEFMRRAAKHCANKIKLEPETKKPYLVLVK